MGTGRDLREQLDRDGVDIKMVQKVEAVAESMLDAWHRGLTREIDGHFGWAGEE